MFVCDDAETTGQSEPGRLPLSSARWRALSAPLTIVLPARLLASHR
jgi:hypothetical protein